MLSESDIKQIKQNGKNVERILEQLEYFHKGFPPVNLIASATAGNGITRFSDEEVSRFAADFNEIIQDKKIVKFVPASGAATRMFRFLQIFRSRNLTPYEQEAEIVRETGFDTVQNFFSHLSGFAFYNELSEFLDNKKIKIDKLDINGVIDFILYDKGLNYSNIPKAFIPFHKYGGKSRTSFEEHLAEAALYCKSSDGKARVHFTISPEYIKKFTELTDKVIKDYSEKFNVKYEIEYSVQNQATDTIAVEMNNEPLRHADGSFVFRPGGHGALIDNLNNIDAGIIFIKNIDNVVPDNLKGQTVIYKKLIGAYLVIVQNRIFSYLNRFDTVDTDDQFIDEVKDFIENRLCFKIPLNIKKDQLAEYLRKILDRPIRVCGMVKNEGEPGGGPFWVKNSDGSVSLQIVEMSQIDTENTEQNDILKSATYFNPVDLACATKDYRGNKFNLFDYIDNNTGSISIKSKDHKELKALELPGLWNGAMANWNTVFIEVPLITFKPVKTINDLLRKEHLSE